MATNNTNEQTTPELVEILKSLEEHHRALRNRIVARSPSRWMELTDAFLEVESLLPELDADELTFGEVRCKIIEAKEREQAKDLKDDDDPRDPERVWRLQKLERQFDQQSLAEMLPRGEKVTDDNYEAVRAESDVYLNHPIHLVCREISERSELSPAVVFDVAERLCDGCGLGAWTEYGEPEWNRETRKLVEPVVRRFDDLEHVPKIFKKLDRDGSTRTIWQKLREANPGVVAEVWPATAGEKSKEPLPSKRRKTLSATAAKRSRRMQKTRPKAMAARSAVIRNCLPATKQHTGHLSMSNRKQDCNSRTKKHTPG